MLRPLFIALLFLLATPLIRAVPNGTDTGGGGYGVFTPDSRIFLYDLYEGKVQSPYIDQSRRPRPYFLNAVSGALERLPYLPTDLVAFKLEELAQTHELLAYIIADSIAFHNWNDDSEPVLLVNDLHYHKIAVPQNVRLLASRYSQNITVSRTYTALLNRENLAALVLHEALYSLTGNAVTTRGAVAYLFSETSHREKYRNLLKRVSLLRRGHPACDIYSEKTVRILDAETLRYRTKHAKCKVSFFHSSEFYAPGDPDAGAAVLRRYVLRTEFLTAKF